MQLWIQVSCLHQLVKQFHSIASLLWYQCGSLCYASVICAICILVECFTSGPPKNQLNCRLSSPFDNLIFSSSHMHRIMWLVIANIDFFPAYLSRDHLWYFLRLISFAQWSLRHYWLDFWAQIFKKLVLFSGYAI